METLIHDLRFALRAIRRSPGAVAAAVISLALGIGANVTIFSAADVFLFRPLPYEEADRLVYVFSSVPDRGWTNNVNSIPDFLDFREESGTMDVASMRSRNYNLSGGDRPERIEGRRVSWNFFRVLRVRPILGRTFLAEEERDGQHRVAIISDELWRRRFGAETSIIGQTLLLDSEVYTIVGVLPPKFWYGSRTTEIWTPFGITGEEDRGSHFLHSFARLEPNATVEQANAEIEAIAYRLAEAYPESNEGWSAGVKPLRDEVFPVEFQMGSLISSVAVAFVLLIACFNVANLMLTRVAERGREIALRGALGAGRGRIVRQFLTEAMMVSFLGGAAGLALSVAGIGGFVSIMPAWFPRADEIGLDGRVLIFALVVTVLSGIIFGTAPALQCARANLVESLKEGGRGNVGSRGDRMRKALVVSEVTLALALLVASALLVKGFLRLQTRDYGWDEENLLTFRITLPEKDYPNEESVSGFYRDVVERLASLPGVESVGGSSILPMKGESNTYYDVPGQEAASLTERPVVSFRFVLPGYFRTMKIPLVRGRLLDDRDRPDTRQVIVVNEALVDRHWPGEDPIGKRITFWDESREIVGVVHDTIDVGNEPRPMAFMSVFQNSRNSMNFAIRTGDDPTHAAEPVRAEVLALDPNLPIYDVWTMVEVMQEAMGGSTIMAKIMSVLGGVALVLSIVGVYGVMAYTISQRTQEMGIRMALGARRIDVLGMILRQGTRLAVIGIAAGLLVAAAVAQSLSIFLFGVSPYDPPVFGGVTLTLLLCGLVATYLPARRATRVDPVDALRYE
jgi:putative ABC transport system permease protein